MLIAVPGVPWNARSQSLTLLDIDTRSYPLVSAGFYAFDTDGNRILSLLPGEFVLTENGEVRRVVNVSCPPVQAPGPISAVLTIDVSGSMFGGGLALAQAAAYAWIDAIPAGQSECAVTSFNTQNALHQDFTNDKTLLRSAVAGLQAGGGTSFDAAFTFPFAGALGVVARGKHKKVVVLLTDGHAGGREQEILDMARQVGAQVFCITLDNVMPEVLRHVAEQTGGRWFENVTTPEQARSVYRSILEFAQDQPPCIITWESGGCAYHRSVDCGIPAYGTYTKGSYAISSVDLPHITVLPARVIEFGVVAPGPGSVRSVTLRGEAHPVDISRITPDSPLFTVIDFGGSPPPFTLEPGQERTITIRYTAEDSAYAICRFFIESNACDAGFFATAGDPSTGHDRRVIKLLHPNGGEMFVAGSDTVITWEGVAPTDPVRLEYSTNNGATWRVIADHVTGLSYNWHVPNTPSEACLARVTAQRTDAVPDDMVIIPAGTFIMGDVNGTGAQEERPASRVTITRPFLMGRTEIQLREWKDRGIQAGTGGTGPDDGPAVGISFHAMIEYCNARSLGEGLAPCYVIAGSDILCNFEANGYRLPTEAEWEYACRGGVSEDFYTGGMLEPYCDPVDSHLDLAGWYCGNAGGVTHVCGQKRANAYGLFDMHGNVREQCWGDWTNPYTAVEKVDPREPNPLTGKSIPVARGGSYRNSAAECRSSSRFQAPWYTVQNNLGFRVVRTY